MEIGERIRQTLKVAGLSPRNLGGATRIHYTTIYRAMNSGMMYPQYEHTLSEALSKIEALCALGKLPMAGKLGKKEKTDRLTAMLADK